MRIGYIAAGAAGRYCGNCLQDNALATALRALGEEIVLAPVYTPLRTDLPDASAPRLFLSGVNVFLEQRFEFFRRPRPLLDRLLGSRRLIGLLSRLGLDADPAVLGPLTISMLRGEEGHQHKEIEALAAWLADEVSPDIVHISNALLLGLARRLKEVLRVPIVCGLQGEDIFLERLREPYRTRAVELIRERSRDADLLVASSNYYREHAAESLGLEREKVAVVPPGIPLDGHAMAAARPPGAPVIGYLSRIAPEKGLHILCEAFSLLARDPDLDGVRLKVAGDLAGKGLQYAAGLRRLLQERGLGERLELLGTVDRRTKLEFLGEIDVLAVPALYRDPKALFALEAMASGVPVVVPRHGVFPELIEASGGGLLCEPGDPEDLARLLRQLLLDPEERRRLGESGRRAVLERFNAERMAREMQGLYHRLRALPVSSPTSVPGAS
jgi:glycosyltransferase involved in cell wall biosynthesis